jgi:hypothetical protein
LPFLRFSRDKRGYETTSLVHAGRRQGRQRQRILYWFRTPPGVKVGRPALDEAAIRWIEEHNPDIEFDWQKILEAKPPSAPPSEDQRVRRSRRDKPERRRSAQPQAASASAAPVPAFTQPEPKPNPSSEDPPTVEDSILSEESTVSEEELEEVFVQLADSDEGPEGPTAVSPIEQAVGQEDLTRLRGRYAELLARITECGGDPERIEALRAQADALNPDTWVTDEDARKGLAEFEPRLRDLRAALGLRRRRRSRRGGRRRSAARPQGGPAPEPEPDRGEG